MTNSKFGTLIQEFPAFKDGTVLKIYKDGVSIYFVENDATIVQTYHSDDVDAIIEGMLEAVLGV